MPPGIVIEPLATAVRSQQRLDRALRQIGASTAGYADIDALGGPVVVLGPLSADSADLLAGAVERAEAASGLSAVGV
jgi:hypothetical protein